MTHDYCDDRLEARGQAKFLRDARAVQPWQRRTDPARAQRASMGRKHEVLRGAAAIERGFGVAGSGAKQNHGRSIPEDLEVRPFGPLPWIPFGSMVVGVLLRTCAIDGEAVEAFDHAQ